MQLDRILDKCVINLLYISALSPPPCSEGLRWSVPRFADISIITLFYILQRYFFLAKWEKKVAELAPTVTIVIGIQPIRGKLKISHIRNTIQNYIRNYIIRLK